MPEYKIYYISRELFDSESKEDLKKYRKYTFSPGKDKVQPLKSDYTLMYENCFPDLDMEDLYVKCQNDFGEKPFEGRSMMVGDVVINNGRVYMVDEMGFYQTEWKEEI